MGLTVAGGQADEQVEAVRGRDKVVAGGQDGCAGARARAKGNRAQRLLRRGQQEPVTLTATQATRACAAQASVARNNAMAISDAALQKPHRPSCRHSRRLDAAPFTLAVSA